MKNKIILLCVILSTTLLVACKGQNSDYGKFQFSTSEAQGTSTQIEQTQTVTTSAISKEELLEEENRFKNLLNSLDASEFTKIQIDNVFGGTDEIQTYFSEDPIVIQQWVTLLKKMKISSKQFEIVTGGGCFITFYKGDKKIDIGNFMMPYIYNSATRTMNVIENLSEFQLEFNALLKENNYTGHTSAEVLCS